METTNINDFKVVQFHNSEDFTFTPEMGCMFDGRPISGITGAPGINGGETITLPYHIAHRLAENLAKYVMTRRAPTNPQVDAQGNPMIAAIWDSARLENMKNSYLTELYAEAKPIQQSETDRLFAKMEELKKFVEDNVSTQAGSIETTTPPDISNSPGALDAARVAAQAAYEDKKEVIEKLETLGIKHDKRKNKADLEKLLPTV